jgi:hypothetical protein
MPSIGKQIFFFLHHKINRNEGVDTPKCPGMEIWLHHQVPDIEGMLQNIWCNAIQSTKQREKKTVPPWPKTRQANLQGRLSRVPRVNHEAPEARQVELPIVSLATTPSPVKPGLL